MPYIASGLALYDMLGGRAGGRFEAFGPGALSQRSGAVDESVVVGGFEYTDGVCDDARMVLAVAETARRGGGEALTHAVVTGIGYTGRAWELEVSDRIGGGSVTVRAKTVIDATGAFEADDAGGGADGPVLASRGSHLVVAGDRLPGSRGMTVRVPNRVVFVIPWGRRWLVGTTDIEHHAPVDRPAATREEVDYLLDTVNEVLASDLTRHDILATFAGIRPLVGDGDRSTSDVSREHRIDHDGRGLVKVRGGKYTTYRLIAAEAADVVAERLGHRTRSTTKGVPIAGAAAPSRLEATVSDLVRRGLSDLEARWLVGRHGVDAPEVIDVGHEAGLDGRLHPEMPYLAAEAWWAVHREGALTFDDVLARRTRLAIETADHGAAAASLVSEILAPVHGWTESDARSATASYLASSGREYGVP